MQIVYRSAHADDLVRHAWYYSVRREFLPDQLVFIDETGVDPTDVRRRRGRSRAGNRLDMSQAMVGQAPKKRINFIAAMGVDGMLAVRSTAGNADTTDFWSFVFTDLVRPFLLRALPSDCSHSRHAQ